jgi:hypothetical protein
MQSDVSSELTRAHQSWARIAIVIRAGRGLRSSSELGEDCNRHQSWARRLRSSSELGEEIAIVIRAHLELDAQIVREQTDHRRDGALNQEASLVLTVAVGDAPDGERRFRPDREGT